MTTIDYDGLVELQFERIRAVEDLLAGGAYYADDDECHPMYPHLVAARQILTTAIQTLRAELADRDARLAEAVGLLRVIYPDPAYETVCDLYAFLAKQGPSQ